MQPNECDRLKRLLAECGRGERFIVQGGDCAERFMDCEAGCSACSVETGLFFSLRELLVSFHLPEQQFFVVSFRVTESFAPVERC